MWKFTKIPSRRSMSMYTLYPDLSKSETDFVQSQVELVLNPKCLEKSESEPLEIFPPKSRKFLVQRIETVQKFGYKDFKIPKNKNERFTRNLISIPKLERTLSALKWARVEKSDLDSRPDLILMTPCEIANLYQIAQLNEDSSVLQLIKENYPERGGIVHGLFAKKYIQKTVLSLKILGFQSASDKIRTLNFAAHSPLRFYKMESMMTSVILDDLKKDYNISFEG